MVMRKKAAVGMILALGIVCSAIRPGQANAGGPSGAVQARPSRAAVGQPRFNSYWFVYGEPPYADGVVPWKTAQQPASGFNSYWFVYGMPPYDDRSAAASDPAVAGRAEPPTEAAASSSPRGLP
jgi:hypothetical protein